MKLVVTFVGQIEHCAPVLLLAINVAKNRGRQEKNVASDFDEIQNLKSLWLRDFKF